MKAQVPTSAIIGQIGEKQIFAALREHYNVEDVHTVGKSGDICIENILTLEIKNYKTLIPTSEVKKFRRDLCASDAKCGIFLSLNSPIANYSKFHYEQFLTKDYIPVIFLSTDSIDILRLAIDILLCEVRKPKIFKENNEKIMAKINNLNNFTGGFADLRNTIHDVDVIHHKQCIKLQQSILVIETMIQGTINEIIDIISPTIFKIVSENPLEKFPIAEEVKEELLDITNNIAMSWKLSKYRAQVGPITFIFQKNKAKFEILRSVIEREKLDEISHKFTQYITIKPGIISVDIVQPTMELLRVFSADLLIKKST